jgi:uncharacterized Zn-binding protein involved in type VI secretion
MPAISRDKIDLAKTGHGCHTVIGVLATQFSVKANDKAILRPGDPCMPHTIPVPCPPPAGKVCCVPHPAVVNMGSPTVFAEGKPVARRWDSTDMRMLIMGSPNVYANGSG